MPTIVWKRKKNMKKTFNVTISRIPYDHKPEIEKEVEQLQSSFIYSGMTFNQLVEHSVQPYSYTIAPAVFQNNYRNTANWRSQQVYMIDFDNKISICDVLARFKEYDIVPNYYYTTFRHTESAPRFRVVLLTDLEIRIQENGNKIRSALKRMFPEADSTCFGAQCMFFGGKQAFPLNEDPIPFAKFDQMISEYIIDGDSGKSRGLVSEGVSLCNYYNDTCFETNDGEYLKYLESLKENNFDFEQLRKFKIYRDFEDGEWLYHNQLFGIATNMKWLKGGAKRFNAIMQKHNDSGKTNYHSRKFAIIAYLRNRIYYPMSLENFSPYPEDWQYHNLINGVRVPIGKIDRIKQQECITLEEGTKIFNREVERVMNARDNKIYIFKVPTGFGKTTFLTNQKNQVIAFPTHALKDEVSKKMNVAHIVSPELPEFSSQEINRKIKAYYNMGANEAVRKVLLAIAANTDGVRSTSSDQSLAKQYLNHVNTKLKDDVSILTTHQRAILTSVPNDTIIFDEDPIMDLLSINAVSLNDLILINAKLPTENKFSATINLIEKTVPGTVVPINLQNVGRDILCETLSKNPVKTNVVQFINSSGFIKNSKDENSISYISVRELPIDKKILIMSATAQTHLYERMYPGRVEVIDISNIEFVGKVYQHTDISCSRASLTEEKINDIKSEIGYIPAITFKKTKAQFDHIHLDMHFGNVQGYDGLNGSDIAVVGTPHYNDIVYRLFAFATSIDPNIEGALKRRYVEYGNHRFPFTTFENPHMQRIQLELIEAALVQAVGRARVLRNECVVELYSNLPLSFSILRNAT